MSALLQKAIHNVSERVNDVLYREELDGLSIDTHALRQARELLKVLASIANGADVRRAFGAPGEWGYENELGQGVLELLSGSQFSSRELPK